MRVAVIGAGMSGLTVARMLHENNIEVTVFDKSKGTGGRLSSRASTSGWIDHATPYFSAETDAFADFLSRHIEPEHLQDWSDALVKHSNAPQRRYYIGVPRTSAVSRSLLGSLDFQPSTRIGALEYNGSQWSLYNDGRSLLGHWDGVVVAVPAPQSLALLNDYPAWSEMISRVEMEPCWVAAIRTDAQVADLGYVKIDPHPAIKRITCNSAKPGRNNEHIYVVQAAAPWSQEHLEKSNQAIGAMLNEFFRACIPAEITTEVLFTHRWRYGFTATALGQAYLWDENRKLGVCGDWCLGRRVEDAWHSGHALGSRMLLSSV